MLSCAERGTCFVILIFYVYRPQKYFSALLYRVNYEKSIIIGNLIVNITDLNSVYYVKSVVFLMNEDFIRQRITELRIKKGVSEYRMSTDLGHSKSYIQSISSGRALPSLSEFIFMCEYLGVTPRDFFDEDNSDPILVRQLYNSVKGMPDKDLLALINIAERLNDK